MFLFKQHTLKTKDNLEITTQWQQAQNDYVFQSVKFSLEEILKHPLSL